MDDDNVFDVFIIGEGGFDIRLSPELLARLQGEEDEDVGDEA